MTDVAANASFDVEGSVEYRYSRGGYADHQPRLFHAMGISLMRGRFLNDEEARLAPASVIVIKSARKVWPGTDPIGKTESGLAQTTLGFHCWGRGQYQEPRLECRYQARDVFPAYDQPFQIWVDLR